MGRISITSGKADGCDVMNVKESCHGDSTEKQKMELETQECRCRVSR